MEGGYIERERIDGARVSWRGLVLQADCRWLASRPADSLSSQEVWDRARV